MTTIDETTQAKEPSTGGSRRHASKDQRADIRQRVLGLVERFALVVIFALTLLFFSFWSKTSVTFPTARNFQNVLGLQAAYGILALAIMIPLVCGEFDFSVGSVALVSQAVCAGLMAHNGAPLIVAIIVPVGIGAFLGLNNGNTIARIGVNSLIVTLGIATALTGGVSRYTHGQSTVSGISKSLTDIGIGNWFGIPRTLYFLALVAAGVYYLMEHTPYGRYLHAIGSNRDAARLVGLRVERLVVIAFVLSGVLASVGGIMLLARNGTAGPNAVTIADTLKALAAAYLGATAIKPGKFNVPGTLIAIFFLAFTVTGLSLAGIEGWISDVFTGAALFVAVLISTIVGRKRVGN